MEFRIADTFTDSLTRLSGDEQRAVKTTAFDLQLNPANPGMSFHKLDKAKDKNFWSVRVSGDIRLIVHKNKGDFLLCYVDHHDKAYDWAERRKLEVHPKTGAAQFVEIRETVQEIFIPVYVQEKETVESKSRKLFINIADDILLSYGVPLEWLQDVKEATEERLFALIEHLPAEASDALLELATGGKPPVSQPVIKGRDPFKHPDAQRRFRTMNNMEELERALDFPWDKWAVFLHPAQRQWIEKNYTGAARVSGSAGTGKTIVALHRAVFLAKSNPDSRVLLTTFSNILANALKVKLRRLISNEPHLSEQIDVYAINELGQRLYKANISAPHIASKDEISDVVKNASAGVQGHKFNLAFLTSEWEQVVDTWQLKTWEEYRDVKRLGRKTRLPEQQREILWSIFAGVNQQIKEEKLLTFGGLFNKLTDHLAKRNVFPYDYAVVDEAQDFSVCHLRFLAALGKNNPNALFFAGDIGQRIFQQAFSWMAVGIDIRGRSRTLHVNYRTSHQIRQQADRLLAPKVSDADGNIEERGNTISVFNGVEPAIKTFQTNDEEILFVGDWILAQIKDGIAPHEVSVFVRSFNEVPRAIAAVAKAKVPYVILDESVESINGKITISTMHYAKGLEFKSVVVMACDDEVIPLQERIESVTDNADLEEVYNTERHLLYVACTRARDCLLVTSVDPASEFLEDLRTV
ncbi:MAG: 3'-5' exonuclease [Chitinophagaceae bacterium]